jgi:N utilization substance protein B
MARRSRAREVALQLLFQHDLNPTPVPRPEIEKFVHERLLGDRDLAEYCLALYDGTLAHRAEIDPRLTETATNWRLSRMLPVDRNVLRLATYELLHDPAALPVEVVITEAIQLAHRFGSADSPKFVNGILDRIARLRNPGPGAAAEAPPPHDSPHDS